MNTHADKTQENKSHSVANAFSQKKSANGSTFQFVDNRPKAVTQRKLQQMTHNSPNVMHIAQLKAIAKHHSVQPIQRLSDEQVQPLRALDISIDDAIEGSVMRTKDLINFDVPDFIENQIRIKSIDISAEKLIELTHACNYYIQLFKAVEASPEVADFDAKSDTLGGTYKFFTADTAVIKSCLSVDNANELNNGTVATRTAECIASVKNLVGRSLATLGLDLKEEYVNEGSDIRNRGAGPEVEAVDKMLSLGMIKIDKVMGIYKSEHDETPGSLGSEWEFKNGGISTHKYATIMADDISKNWVLHAHVKNVIANQYNYKPVSLSSGGFHLKDKATASGGDGPSVNVKTAHVKDDAENTLLTYIDDKKHAIRKKWFKAGYMVSE